MITRLRYPKGYQFFNSNGTPLALGNLYYYAAGTTTPQNTYSDSTGATPNTNPIVLDGSGRLDVDVYLGSTTNYKEVLTTSAATVSPWPDDNIPAATTVFTGDTGSGGTTGLVPAPAAGDAFANKFLSASGGWSTLPGLSASVNLNTSAATSSGSTLTFSSVPSSIAVGMSVSDATTSGVVPSGTTVASVTSTTVTLSAAVTGAGVATGDTINFSSTASAATNLTASETATSVSIASSSGSGCTIPAATDSTAGVLDSARAAKIDGLAAVATTGSYSSLSGAPTFGTAAAQNIPASGNATASQVVIGSDTRLSDSRTPLAHAATHASGGSDPVSISVSQVSGLSGTYAPLASPTFTGTPTAPTQTAGDNSTKLATTAYLDSKLGANNGIATLDGGAKLSLAQIPSSLVGALVYQGVWNAGTNTPTLASGVGTKGNYYKVSVAGTTSIDGNASWNVGDTIVFDGTAWDKIDGISNEVVQVAGLYGNISASALKSALAIGASDVSGLAAVATTGSYTSLSNTPTIPAAQVNSDWNATSGLAQILNKPSLATVATTGSYTSLLNTPSNMTGATSSAAGTAGFVPPPAAGQQSSYLQGSGTFAAPFADNYTVGAELNPSTTFTSLSAWTQSGNAWTTVSGGGVTNTGGGSMSLVTGNTFAANTIYHVHIVIAANPDNITLYCGNDAIAIYEAGTFDFYLISPAAGAEGVNFTHYGTNTVTVSSLSFKPIAYAQKSLLGGLNLMQGGPLLLPAGNQVVPSLQWQDPNGAAPGVWWNPHGDTLNFGIQGSPQLQIQFDSTGASPQITGLGTNRLTINSQSALVLQPASGHMEWEGSNSALSTLNSSFISDFEVVGYAAGSSIGHGIRIRGEASSGNQPQYLFGVMAGQAASDTLPGIIVIDHTGTVNGTWYPNGKLVALTHNGVTITQPASGATLTLANGSTFATGGAYSVTLTATANTNVTLPASGTLATTAQLPGTFAGSTAGIVPASAGGTVNFLRADGTWASPPSGGSTATMTGATASVNGTGGSVPAPVAGQQNYVLTGAGTWGALGTAASLNVPSSGNASSAQVVLGSDTRLSGLAGQNIQNASYTFALSDAGGDVMHTDTTTTYIYTIPPGSSVNFPLETTIVVTNYPGAGTLTIAPGSGVTLQRLDGTAGTGNRTIAASGAVTLRKLTTGDVWGITGAFS